MAQEKLFRPRELALKVISAVLQILKKGRRSPWLGLDILAEVEKRVQFDDWKTCAAFKLNSSIIQN